MSQDPEVLLCSCGCGAAIVVIEISADRKVCEGWVGPTKYQRQMNVGHWSRSKTFGLSACESHPDPETVLVELTKAHLLGKVDG